MTGQAKASDFGKTFSDAGSGLLKTALCSTSGLRVWTVAAFVWPQVSLDSDVHYSIAVTYRDTMRS
jgi:hypothetical protein